MSDKTEETKQVKREELTESTIYVFDCPYCGECTEVYDETDFFAECIHCGEGIEIVD